MTVKLSKFKEVNLKKPAPKGIAVYGEPMAGKTTFAGQAERPLFLSFDGNAKLAGYNAVTPTNKSDVISVIEQAEEYGYKTIVIDTVEDMAQLLETEILEKYDSDNLKTANGGYGAGYSEFNKNFTEIINLLSRSDLNVYYLLRARQTEDEGLVIVLKEKLFSIIGGYSDALVEINNKHEAKWKKKRYDWDDKTLPVPLDKIIDPEKAKAAKLAELGL